MSSRGINLDFNPLLKKVQTDINFLCYLGLHQYAKENNLIGRSRPMITPELSFVKQKRLNFRLMVACLQQVIGSKTMEHNGRIEQVNYVNVGEYSTMRLYGLLDKDMFAVYTEEDRCYTGWWPQQLDSRDWDPLRSPAPIDVLMPDLNYNTRAMIEVGGNIFAEKLRSAIRLIPREVDGFQPHQQRDPKNRLDVRNIAVNLKLIEHKHHRTHYRATGLAREHIQDAVKVPTNIEQLLHFRHVLWPWIQTLQTQEARDAFTYVAQNFPSVHAVQMKIRQIRESQQERERLMRLQQERAQEQEQAREDLRDRLLAIYGERQREPMGEAEAIVMLDHEDDAEFFRADTHIGADGPWTVTNNEMEARVRRALGLPIETDDDENDPEIPF
jgi:hypothetical protein